MVKTLKKVGIEYKKDSKGTSCLHIAIMRGHTHIVDFLLKKTPKSAVTELKSVEQIMASEKLSKEDA